MVLLSSIEGSLSEHTESVDECSMLDYITMHLAKIKDRELVSDEFYYPNEFSPSRIVISLCKGVSVEMKARCGVGSETELGMVFLEDEACVAHRMIDQRVTSRIRRVSGQLIIDILYPRSRVQLYDKDNNEEFDIIKLRYNNSEPTHLSKIVEKSRKTYNVLLNDNSMTANIYTIYLPLSKKGVITSEKKNFVSHTNLNDVETIISWTIHTFYIYGTFYHNHHTRNFMGIKPFNWYLVYFVPMRVIGWVDAAFYKFTENKRRESEWVVTAVYILSPVVLGYYMEGRERSMTLKWLLPIYFFINFADFIIINMFLSTLIGLLCVIFYAIVFFLPMYWTAIANPKEWRVSQAISIELFMQHILWLPFKKIGALKFYMNGLQAYYITKEMLIFASLMIVLHVPVSYFRYYLSSMRSEMVREDVEDFKIKGKVIGYKSMAEITYND